MAFNIRCSYYLLELSQRCCSAQTDENKKGFLCRTQASGVRQRWPEPFPWRGRPLPPLREASLTPHPASTPLLTNAFLICLTGNWITTRSAVLKMGHLGLCVTWKCCKYSLYLLLVARAQYLGSTNVAAYLRAAAWCQDALVKRCLKIIHSDVL